MLTYLGDNLRIRCRKFPALVDCCTIDWFSAWPQEALYSVSLKLLDDYVLPTKEIKITLASMCRDIHTLASAEGDLFELALKRLF